MKNLILASFLTLIFTQDLITTRVFQVPLSYLIEIAENSSGDGVSGSAFGSALFLADFCGISEGYIDYAKIYAGEDSQIDLYLQSETGYINLGAGHAAEISRGFSFDENSPEDECEYELDYDTSLIGYVELWVTGNYGDEVGLIDDLQDQINDLEVQVEGLLAELLDCQGCNGDVNTDENIDILDVITVVQHILDTDTDGCIEN